MAKIEQIDVSMISNGMMRPFRGKDGRTYALIHQGGSRDNKANWKKIPITGNAALRYDEWRTLDDAVRRISRNRLVGIDDLRRFGLVYPLNNAMATTVLTWEKISDAMVAEIAIDPVKKTDGDKVTHSTHHLPIPVTHSDFKLSERTLQESRNRGNGLDVSNVEASTRKVMEKLEDMLFGTTSLMTYGGGTLYTYLTEPNVNEILFDSVGTYWDESSVTPKEIKDMVLSMKQALIDDNHYGPYVMYIPTNYDTVMDDDYRDGTSSSSTQTIRQRLLAINGIQDIIVADRLPSDVVVMVQTTSDVVDLVDGMPMQTVEWGSEGNFVHNYKVLTIVVPRIKSDYEGRSGICVLTPSSYKA